MRDNGGFRCVCPPGFTGIDAKPVMHVKVILDEGRNLSTHHGKWWLSMHLSPGYSGQDAT
jgi:hypothetical protein